MSTNQRSRRGSKTPTNRKRGPAQSAAVRVLRLIYQTNPEPISIAKLSKHPAAFFDDKKKKRRPGATEANLSHFCTKQNWPRERDEFWAKVMRDATKKSGTKASDIIASQFQIAKGIRDMAHFTIQEKVKKRVKDSTTKENPKGIPLTLEEAWPALFKAMAVERDLLLLTEAEFDEEDEAIEIEPDDAIEIRRLASGDDG